jgi:hypothetical protein
VAVNNVNLVVWSLSGAHLTGIRFGVYADPPVTLDLPCAADSLDVDLRAVLSHCPDGSFWLSNARTSMATWRLPLEPGDGAPVVGTNYVAWSHRAGDGRRVVVVVDVDDFTHDARTFGPIADGTEPVPDDTTNPILGYVDPDGTIRMAGVYWLQSRPTDGPDVTAPHWQESGVTPAVTTGKMTFGWSYFDPGIGNAVISGLDHYQAQWQQRPVGAAGFQPWNDLPLTGRQRSVDVTNDEDVDTCFRVRAYDWAGNVSDWSPVSCSVVDRTAPRLTSAATAARIAPGSSLGFRYAFTDRHGLASYDLEYREAPLAVAPGAWTHPAAWYGAKATSVVRTAPAGSDTCFRVRARDVAGNLTGWSAPQCEAAPLDDKALSPTGTVRRVATKARPSGQVSTMFAAGDTLTYRGVRTNHLALVGQVGPNEGAVDVLVGSTKVGRASFATSRAGWGTVWLPWTAMLGGKLTLVRVAGTKNVTIDGVAVLQQ